MFFLLRMAFWFSLVLLALPLDTGASAEGRPQVGPLQALSAAREAIGDLVGLCDRKPQVCETGLDAAGIVAARARESGRIAFSLLGEEDDASLPDGEAVTGTFPPSEPHTP